MNYIIYIRVYNYCHFEVFLKLFKHICHVSQVLIYHTNLNYQHIRNTLKKNIKYFISNNVKKDFNLSLVIK